MLLKLPVTVWTHIVPYLDRNTFQDLCEIDPFFLSMYADPYFRDKLQDSFKLKIFDKNNNLYLEKVYNCKEEEFGDILKNDYQFWYDHREKISATLTCRYSWFINTHVRREFAKDLENAINIVLPGPTGQVGIRGPIDNVGADTLKVDWASKFFSQVNQKFQNLSFEQFKTVWETIWNKPNWKEKKVKYSFIKLINDCQHKKIKTYQIPMEDKMSTFVLIVTKNEW